MVLQLEEQILTILQGKSNILLALVKNPSLDAIASALGLALALEKMKKKVKIVSAGFNLLPEHSFLPKSQEIHADLATLRKFIISLDISQAPVEDVAYAISDNKLNIYVTPKSGFYEQGDVNTSAGEFTFDLIITLEVPDLPSLGGVYENNTEFFYHTPIVNIDHQPANEHYGQINLVQLTATSISEIIFELIKDWDILDEYIATNLLTGIISKTKSFKSNTVTPRSLAIASHLIASGARREEIVRNLYQSKSVSTLKLWGRALSKLQTISSHKIVWAILGSNDFSETQSRPEELDEVIDELIVNTPEAESIFILYPAVDKVKCLLATPKYIDAFSLFKEFSPTGTADFTYLTLPLSLGEAQNIILERLKTAKR